MGNCIAKTLRFCVCFWKAAKRAMQLRCAMRFEPHAPKSLAMRNSFFASDAKTHLLDLKSQETCQKNPCENPAILACDAKNQHAFKDRAMRNACDSDSRCGLACDARARDAKSLAMGVERCEPLSASRILKRCCSCCHERIQAPERAKVLGPAIQSH